MIYTFQMLLRLWKISWCFPLPVKWGHIWLVNEEQSVWNTKEEPSHSTSTWPWSSADKGSHSIDEQSLCTYSTLTVPKPGLGCSWEGDCTSKWLGSNDSRSLLTSSDHQIIKMNELGKCYFPKVAKNLVDNTTSYQFSIIMVCNNPFKPSGLKE